MSNWKYWMIDSCKVYSIMIVGAGASAILGHILGFPLMYRWYATDVGISLPSATAFVLAGIAIFVLSERLDAVERKLDKVGTR